MTTARMTGAPVIDQGSTHGSPRPENFEEYLSQYPLQVDIGRKVVHISRDQLDRVSLSPRTGNRHD
jgi:hypothetical protein